VKPRLWIDANVIVRHITGDPPDMARRVGELMKRAERGEVVLLTFVLNWGFPQEGRWYVATWVQRQ